MIRINFLKDTKARVERRRGVPSVTLGAILILTAITVIVLLLVYLLVRSFLTDYENHENTDINVFSSYVVFKERPEKVNGSCISAPLFLLSPSPRYDRLRFH